MSERRAGQVLDKSRSAQRYEAVVSDGGVQIASECVNWSAFIRDG